jgi:hypothetical protein
MWSSTGIHRRAFGNYGKAAEDLSSEERGSTWVLFGESGIAKVKLSRPKRSESVNMTIKAAAMKDPEKQSCPRI